MMIIAKTASDPYQRILMSNSIPNAKTIAIPAKAVMHINIVAHMIGKLLRTMKPLRKFQK